MPCVALRCTKTRASTFDSSVSGAITSSKCVGRRSDDYFHTICRPACRLHPAFLDHTMLRSHFYVTEEIMSTFKVQKIRSCVQCGDLLSLKCKSCAIHPERKPRVIDLYDWPPILATGPCGCIKILCQAEGCGKTTWRNPSRCGRGGKATSKKLFCSYLCSTRTLAAAKNIRQKVPCAYCEKITIRKSYLLKIWALSFCNRSCYFLHRAKKSHEAKEAAIAEKRGTDGRALLQCGKCRDVTEHREINANNAKCEKCSTIRSTIVKVLVNA